MTTSTVVTRGPNALLIDPSWEPDELEGLADALADRELTVTAGFSTHAHHDHLLWHRLFGTAPRWGSAKTTAAAAQHHESLVASMGADWPSDLGILLGQLRVATDEVPAPFGAASDEPVVLVTHDGHAPGHTALWLPERRVLLAGDMLSDLELPLPADADNMSAYLAGLDLLTPYVTSAEILVPGHGNVTSQPSARLDADRRYLDALLAGREPDDRRMLLPGMAQAHRVNTELAREYAAG